MTLKHAQHAPLIRRQVVTAAPAVISQRRLTPPEQRARARWRKTVAAIVADALASNRGLLERLKRGMHAPEMEHKEQYQVILNGLFATTREQIAALEVFARVDWSE
jgi:bacterioferritin (cytochrome b1)